MTNLPPPVTPGYSPLPPQGDWTPPKPKSRATPWLIGILGVLVVVVISLAIALAGQGAGKPGTQIAATDAEAAPVVDDPEPAATTAKPGNRPYASQFELTPKITDKQCFGSAGCNVELEVKVSYTGAALSEDDTWQITYQITGDESGPIIGSTELTGTTYDVNTEMLSTKSSKTKIAIKVTEVEKVGL